MSKNRHIARHRATPPSALKTVSKAVSSHAGSFGRPAAVLVAASGLMLSAGLPANASGEVAVPPAASTPAVQSAGSATYTVQAGDTLGNIAAAQGVSLDSIFALNGLTWDSVIFPGDVISLSGSATQATQVAAPAPAVAPAAAVTVAAPAPAAPAETSTLGITTASEAITPMAAASTQASGSGIVGTALSMIGSGYVYGGTTPGAWDCSGFVQWVFAQNGIDLPRTSQAQMAASARTDNPQPGDLVIQNGGGHVGIYLGDGQMISALNPSQGTLIHAVDAMPVVGYYTP
ncbi:C40 family peptidase [Arthrobacter sp. AET 35A]|uniref:C40 family peptidase n=1 Tax=Arthrobacter sp. AET 35A TaxID=2292643 RepID=UPI00177F0585|nr:C40 family peptidase [Arthrobacter sp. AET 35A]MBE0010908.1 peptidoglycan endopeptidase [Arthrobacter sp. AET 35A]